MDPLGLVVSVSTSSFPDRVGHGIDIKKLAKQAHFLNVLSYEYHTTWTGKVGANAPLYCDQKSICIVSVG